MMAALEKVSKLWLKGLCCAPCTPFKKNGDLNLSIIPKYVDHLMEFGVSNLFVNGTTGEGNNMTVSERKEAAQAWMDAAKGKLDALIIHIGAGNLRESQELATHAEGIGAHAIACVSPTYYKPKTVEAYVDYMAQVAAAAPNTPFFLYDIDFFTGVHHSVDEFFTLGVPRIPTLRGVKHTSPDFMSMKSTMKHKDARGYPVQVLLGADETLVEALAIGMDVTVMNSFMGKVEQRLIDAFNTGDLETARMETNRINDYGNVRRRMKLGIVEGSKALVRMVGVDVGPPRLPMVDLTPQQEEELRAKLKDIGFFEWALGQ